MDILTRHCLGDRPVRFQVLSDQAQNFTTGWVGAPLRVEGDEDGHLLSVEGRPGNATQRWPGSWQHRHPLSVHPVSLVPTALLPPSLLQACQPRGAQLQHGAAAL